jgi:hypothetical protein
MAGYSGTPLSKKLGIRPGAVLYRVNPPPELDLWLAPLPPGVLQTDRPPKPRGADVVLCFIRSRNDLSKRFPAAKRALKTDGGLWIAWPKLAARKVDPCWESDLTEHDIRALGLASGLVDNKVCAISDIWSGLRLVYRLKDR